jgi:hypothetical protein
MREKPLVDSVDVVVGDKDDERLITVARPIAERWPEHYRPAVTGDDEPATSAKKDASPRKPRQTAAAKRAKDLRGVDPAPVQVPDELPSPTDTTSAPAVAADAGTSGVTTKGVTP